MLIKFNSFILCLLISLTACIYSSAASFDCAKVTNQIETMICSSPGLSKLDSELGTLYKSLKKHDSNIVLQQKIWLQEKRNSCKTINCLNIVYVKRIEELKKVEPCFVSQQAMLGGWKRIKNGFFEEMFLSVNEGNMEFNSWLHHRPEMNGTWEIDSCTLRINGNQKSMQFVFRIKKLEKGKLYLSDEDDDKIAIYKKIPEVLGK